MRNPVAKIGVAVALCLLVAGISLSRAGVVLTTATTTATDAVPEPFTFTDQSDVSTSATITSTAVTISGIATSITCSATDGTIDLNSGGSFASSQSVANNDTIRARHTSSASNSTAVSTVVACNGVSDTFTSTTEAGGASGVFFNPDIDAISSVLEVFDDQNNTPFATISTTVVRPGHTQSIRLTYTADEDGTDLILEGESVGGQMPATASLFVRSYERFEGDWAGNWPQGLKTLRIFASPNLIGCQDAPNNHAYVSEKIIYPGYDTSPDPRLEDYVVSGSWAYCDPVGGRPEIEATYTAGQVFDNDQPYIRTGHWYKWERWYVMNSAPDAADGIMQIWIDNELVLNRTNVVYRASSPSIVGTHWQSMWWGGNFSNTGTFNATPPLERYISDPYASTTLDR